jgi:hypothetical protein
MKEGSERRKSMTAEEAAQKMHDLGRWHSFQLDRSFSFA